MAEFLGFLDSGGATVTSAKDARDAVAAAVFGARSIRSGGAVLPIPGCE